MEWNDKPISSASFRCRLGRCSEKTDEKNPVMRLCVYGQQLQKELLNVKSSQMNDLKCVNLDVNKWLSNVMTWKRMYQIEYTRDKKDKNKMQWHCFTRFVLSQRDYVIPHGHIDTATKWIDLLITGWTIVIHLCWIRFEQWQCVAVRCMASTMENDLPRLWDMNDERVRRT